MGLSWLLGVNTEDCVVWARGAVTSEGKGERPPAVALVSTRVVVVMVVVVTQPDRLPTHAR